MTTAAAGDRNQLRRRAAQRTWRLAAARRRTTGTRRSTSALLLLLHALALAVCLGLVVSAAGASVLRPVLLLFLLIVGTAAVAWPGSGAGLVAVLGVVAGYVALTLLGEVLDVMATPSAARVLLLAGCLYVAHATDALRGAVVGADLDRSVLVRWLRRLAEALLPGVAVGAVVVSLPTGDGASPVWLVGAVAVLAAAAVPALSVQRRPWRTGQAAAPSG